MAGVVMRVAVLTTALGLLTATPALAATIEWNINPLEPVLVENQKFEVLLNAEPGEDDPLSGFSIEIALEPDTQITGLKVDGSQSDPPFRCTTAGALTTCTTAKDLEYATVEVKFRVRKLGDGETDKLTATLKRDGVVQDTSVETLTGDRLFGLELRGPFLRPCPASMPCGRDGTPYSIPRRLFGRAIINMILKGGDATKVRYRFNRCTRTGGCRVTKTSRLITLRPGKTKLTFKRIFGRFKPNTKHYFNYSLNAVDRHGESVAHSVLFRVGAKP